MGNSQVELNPEVLKHSKLRGHYPRLHGAINSAVVWHMGQDRKYTKVPYICHPIAVMEIVRTVTDDEDMLIAAVLHDVVEDTPVEISTIKMLYGERVAELVGWLTDVSVPEDGNRNVRKDIDRMHTAKAPPDAKTIKLADLIHNTESITQHDKDFARVYMKEKELLLGVITEGNHELWNRANLALQNYQNELLQEALK